MNAPIPERQPADEPAAPRGAERGAPPTLEALYREHCATLLRYVHRRTGDVHVTEDLVAEVFVDVARALPRYRDLGLPVRFWLLRIAGNAVNRWRARSRPWVPLDEDPPDRRTGPGVVDGDLRRAFLALPPRFQDVLALHHLEGHSTADVARILGCREGTVRSRLTRARARLRKRLTEIGWTPGASPTRLAGDDHDELA